MAEVETTIRNVNGSDDDHEEDNKKTKGGKSRRELPAGAVATLKAWLLSPEHFTHPYPTPQDQIMLMQKTGIDKKQLKNWFTNARRRIWKPMLKKQLEQGKMTQTGSGAVVALSPATAVLTSAPAIAGPAGGGNGEYSTMVDPSQVMQQNYQQALQQQPQNSLQQQSQNTQQHQYDSFGNPIYQQQQQQQQQQPLNQQNTYNNTTNTASYFPQNQYNMQQHSSAMASSHSIGSLPHMPGATPPGSMTNLNKTDSHAVLMELFARDQDLVRQATEGAKQRGLAQNSNSNNNDQNSRQGMGQGGGSNAPQLGSQHPMSKMVSGGPSMNKLGNAPSLNSWPHFSSVSSLNNLGTMTGVKSITNMSGADLVSQGSLNRKGNLAQVKSIENMGRADSYAFLEVFFDSASSNPSSQIQRGIKREREEDDNVGLSLDVDEQSPSMNNAVGTMPNNTVKDETSGLPLSLLPSEDKDQDGLKRAYDDALAARGLISVSRSSENLTDLALPAKMQRTISQEYLKGLNACNTSTNFGGFSYNSNGPVSQSVTNNQVVNANTTSQQHFSHPAQPLQKQSENQSQQMINDVSNANPNANGNTQNLSSGATNPSVEVPATTKCAICHCVNVDTQLRPCGCMFHGRCLKPSLQNAVGTPKCPIDNITMQSAVLAIPTDENANSVTGNNKISTNGNSHINNSTSASTSTSTSTSTSADPFVKQEVKNS